MILDTLPMLSAILTIAAMGLRAYRRTAWLRGMDRADAMAGRLP